VISVTAENRGGDNFLPTQLSQTSFRFQVLVLCGWSKSNAKSRSSPFRSTVVAELPYQTLSTEPLTFRPSQITACSGRWRTTSDYRKLALMTLILHSSADGCKALPVYAMVLVCHTKVEPMSLGEAPPFLTARRGSNRLIPQLPPGCVCNNLHFYVYTLPYCYPHKLPVATSCTIDSALPLDLTLNRSQP
jgi:hypothetical protein